MCDVLFRRHAYASEDIRLYHCLLLGCVLIPGLHARNHLHAVIRPKRSGPLQMIDKLIKLSVRRLFAAYVPEVNMMGIRL